MNLFLDYIKSSIGKKQVVAVSGLLLIIFVIGHLAGNLLLILGPEAFNWYAEHLASLRPGLYVVEFALGGIFIVHIWLTASLVIENYRARPVGYRVIKNQGERSLATRLMPYSGTVLFAFIIFHLLDFTFTDHYGDRAILPDGVNYGLYGVVYNTFTDPIHSTFYVIAMLALGLHLAHGIESFFQTFGFNHPKYTPIVKNVSNGLGIFIALGFSAVPVFVMVDCLRY